MTWKANQKSEQSILFPLCASLHTLRLLTQRACAMATGIHFNLQIMLLLLLSLSAWTLVPVHSLSFPASSSSSLPSPSTVVTNSMMDSTYANLHPKPSIVLCPGFGNDVKDYISPLNAPAEIGFRHVLERRGFRVHIVPVQRLDWIRVALGLLDWQFYSSNQLATGLAYGWYIQRVIDTIHEASKENEINGYNMETHGEDNVDASADAGTEGIASANTNNPVLLVGHSAGGWLARAALGELLKRSANTENQRQQVQPPVCGLVTLGTPHFPPPDGINCATRGALKNTNMAYPGAYWKDLVYVTVAGNAITGGIASTNGDVQSRPVDSVYAKRGEGSAHNVAKVNYEALTGQFDGVAGDGVIPISIAHLEGSEQITLDGVLHSINEAGTALLTDSWYGSEQIVDKWLMKTLEKLNVPSGVLDTSSATN